ncbi:CPCC family cysteine-rich protein [Streptomyces sp. NPDC012794]|uniref:CPCC family cysteine-rich protein n=1 Tax=Streptomyces sp. NPDC012794 TaxID=3364850 RepID=UPI0036B9D1A6
MTSVDPPPAPSNDPANGLVTCPCCFERTLEERANFEICPECGWEDDGQGDADAHLVRGGPNGSLSLTQARLDYLEEVAETGDESVTRGGEGLWRSEARRQVPGLAELGGVSREFSPPAQTLYPRGDPGTGRPAGPPGS